VDGGESENELRWIRVELSQIAAIEAWMLQTAATDTPSVVIVVVVVVVVVHSLSIRVPRPLSYLPSHNSQCRVPYVF